MLTVRVVGGLGNQLFLYALYRYIKKSGRKAKLDTGFYKDQDLSYVDRRQYVLEDYFDLNAEYISLFERLFFKAARRVHIYDALLYKDRGKGYEHDIDAIDRKIIEGYWQTFYFADRIRNELLDELAVGRKYQDDELMKRIEADNSVGLHVRRGDYVRLGRTISEEYYSKAIDLICNRISKPVFYCFSDDMDYCRSIFGDKVIYVGEKKDDLYDFCAMSRCRHNITANSTFSAWSAWLNTNSDKIVIHPAEWNGSELGASNDRMWPEGWLCL